MAEEALLNKAEAPKKEESKAAPIEIDEKKRAANAKKKAAQKAKKAAQGQKEEVKAEEPEMTPEQ